jgi:hypothetical protein
MDPNVWTTPYMSKPSSGKNINFEGITDKHIKSFAKFAQLAGACWAEESIYEFVKSDTSKLDFISAIKGDSMTDTMLKYILEVESTYEHAAGSFFSIDLETVNHYFVQALLDAWNDGNKEFLEQYSVM